MLRRFVAEYRLLAYIYHVTNFSGNYLPFQIDLNAVSLHEWGSNEDKKNSQDGLEWLVKRYHYRSKEAIIAKPDSV